MPSERHRASSNVSTTDAVRVAASIVPICTAPYTWAVTKKELKMKTLLATAAIILTFATGATAGDFDDQDVVNALKKRFPDLQEDADISFIGKSEVTFHTPKWHMACRYGLTSRVIISKCRVIHG
jgi:hypothetical protein